MEENEFTPQEIEKWKELIEEMDQEDIRSLGQILSQQKREKDILYTRQSNELISLMHRWKLESAQNI